MANVTLSVDDEVLKRARMRALGSGTSVNALVRGYLEAYAGQGAGHDVIRSVVSIGRKSKASSGSSGRTWTRDDLHNR